MDDDRQVGRNICFTIEFINTAPNLCFFEGTVEKIRMLALLMTVSSLDNEQKWPPCGREVCSYCSAYLYAYDDLYICIYY